MRPDLFKGVILGAIVSTVVLFAASALAGTGVGSVFNLGKANKVDAQTTLEGSTTGRNLQLTNTGSGGGLGIHVAAGAPPIVVSSGAGMARNLNAAEVNGQRVLTFSKFLPSNTTTPKKVMSLGGFTLKLSCDSSHGPTLTGIGSVDGSISRGTLLSAAVGENDEGGDSVPAGVPVSMFIPSDGRGSVIWQYATPDHRVVSICVYVTDGGFILNGREGCFVSGSAIAG